MFKVTIELDEELIDPMQERWDTYNLDAEIRNWAGALGFAVGKVEITEEER